MYKRQVSIYVHSYHSYLQSLQWNCFFLLLPNKPNSIIFPTFDDADIRLILVEPHVGHLGIDLDALVDDEIPVSYTHLLNDMDTRRWEQPEAMPCTGWGIQQML